MVQREVVLCQISSSSYSPQLLPVMMTQMEECFWIAVPQIGMAADEEQVTHEGDSVLRQEEHGIALRVT